MTRIVHHAAIVLNTSVSTTISQLQRQSIQLLAMPSEAYAESLRDFAECNDFVELENDVLAASSDLAPGATGQVGHDGANWIESVPHEPKSLGSHLIDQFTEQDWTSAQRELVLRLVPHLDKHGRLAAEIDEDESFLAVIDEAIGLLQQLSPVGVGARSVVECLLLQLGELPGDHRLTEALIREQLPNVACCSPTELAEIMAVSLDEMNAALTTLLRLDPFPCRAFRSEPVVAVNPELDVVLLDDRTEVRLRDGIPRLRLVVPERCEPRDPSRQEAMRWLQAGQFREATLVGVARVLAARQSRALREGLQHVVPLTRDEVAQELDLDASTISRAVESKYIATPYGIHPLTAFFTSEVAQAKDAAQSCLLELLSSESAESVRADRELAETMRSRGHDVTTRSVARYRQQLGIPSTRTRKRKFVHRASECAG